MNLIFDSRSVKSIFTEHFVVFKTIFKDDITPWYFIAGYILNHNENLLTNDMITDILIQYEEGFHDDDDPY